MSASTPPLGACVWTVLDSPLITGILKNISTTAPALSGSGLNVTTPGTNGCWATGGLVIDNSASGTTGAQQIYFTNLDGAAAGSLNGATPASSNCTAGAGPTIDATQASQSNP